MDIPLARKVNGKKFMWDGIVYDSDESAQQVMEGYACENELSLEWMARLPMFVQLTTNRADISAMASCGAK